MPWIKEKVRQNRRWAWVVIVLVVMTIMAQENSGWLPGLAAIWISWRAMKWARTPHCSNCRGQNTIRYIHQPNYAAAFYDEEYPILELHVVCGDCSHAEVVAEQGPYDWGFHKVAK